MSSAKSKKPADPQGGAAEQGQGKAAEAKAETAEKAKKAAAAAKAATPAKAPTPAKAASKPAAKPEKAAAPSKKAAPAAKPAAKADKPAAKPAAKADKPAAKKAAPEKTEAKAEKPEKAAKAAPAKAAPEKAESAAAASAPTAMPAPAPATTAQGAAQQDKEVLLTYEGLKKLESDLEYYRGEKRREVAERMKQAKSFGDISENSEYDEARMEQAQVEARILQLENTLKNARIIDEDDVNTEKVSIGCRVRILDQEFDEESEFHIVGSTEANPIENRISNESPVGAALLGKGVGAVVEVQTPSGLLHFKVLEITK